MPHSQGGRGQQDRPHAARSLRPQDRPGRGLLLHRRQQAEGHHLGRELPGMWTWRSQQAVGVLLTLNSSTTSRTPRSTSPAPKWLSAVSRRPRTETTSSPSSRRRPNKGSATTRMPCTLLPRHENSLPLRFPLKSTRPVVTVPPQSMIDVR